jgi:hypothetical protein
MNVFNSLSYYKCNPLLGRIAGIEPHASSPLVKRNFTNQYIGTLNLLTEAEDKINSKCVVFKEWKYGTNLYIYFVDE